jgi:hypothetical protein
MSKDLDLNNLNALCRYLLGRYHDVSVHLEATTVLLQKHGIFSQEEYAETLERVRREWDETMRATLLRSADAAQSEAIRQILEDYEGPAQ